MAEDRPQSPEALVRQIVSGGQTGVDRAALDVAIELDIAHGGWCPQGRRAEDGPIPACYALTETASSNYAVRTEQNVVDSDATLILYLPPLQGGTELTYRLAQKHGRPVLLVDLSAPSPTDTVRRWLRDHAVRILNIAGPRQSQHPDLYRLAREYLIQVFDS